MNISVVPINVLKKLIASGKCKLTVQGNSMYPTLVAGDIVEIHMAKEVDVNDIVVIHQDGRNVIHRVVVTSNDFIITKGDNNKYIDYIVPKSCVLGKIESNYSKKFQYHDRRIVYNFWDKECYQACQEVANDLRLEFINCPEYYMEDALNIAIHPYSMKELHEIQVRELPHTNICIHIGAPISDFEMDGFILDKCFDEVCRAGSILSAHILTKKENFLIIYAQILTLFKEFEEIC